MKKKYKNRLLLTVVLLSISFRMSAAINSDLNSIITYIVKNRIDESDNRNTRLGEYFCKFGQGINCSGSTIGEGICKSASEPKCNNLTIGDGICRAGGQIKCNNLSIAEGICRAGEHLSCSGVSLAKALCLVREGQHCYKMSIDQAVNLTPIDTDWKWDGFYDQNGKRVWRCRGTLTGRFVEDSKCYWDMKVDNTWP